MTSLLPPMPSLRVAVLTALVLLASGAPARAADPIMPLSQVKKGMQCKSLSVVQGTEISSFDAEVVDVVAGDAAQRQPLILVRVSGAAVDDTGIAEGFSGSPLLCPDDEGNQRNAGAIAYASGDYGGKLALATPIESLLGLSADPPAGTKRNARAVRNKRSLAGPLSVSGLSPPVGAVFRRAADRAGRRIQVAPAAPLTSAFPPQHLVPGASMAVGIASGDVSAGAVGTVTYVDGGKVWGFGHQFDAVGRRTLLLKDAYVYAVIGNPVGLGEAVSRKLAAPGHDLGMITADGPAGIAGRLGALPARIPVRVDARDADTGERHVVNAQVADETAADQPAGGSPLSLVGPMAVSQAAFAVLGSSPARLSGSMCARITVRETRRPIRFCNTYVGAGGGPQDSEEGGLPGGALVSDVAEALAEIDAFQLGELHVTSLSVRMTLRRGLQQAYLVRVRAPRTVRRGRRARLRLTLQRVFGKRFSRTVTVRIPRGAPLGRRDLILTGTPADAGGDDLGAVIDLADALDGEEPTDAGGPRSVGALADRIRGLARYDGVTVAFARPGGRGGNERRVYRDESLRISGRERVRVVVRR
jgi:hypothetical protein